MALRLTFAPSAERDLDEIVAYIARDKPVAAARFVQRLREACAGLARYPNLGEDCSELRPQMRRRVFQKYLIFYRVADDAVQIVRVIHGSRDWTNSTDAT